MKKLITEEFVKKAKMIHEEKYDYSLVEYKNNRTKVKIICPIHGVFEQTPGSHLRGRGCIRCGIIKNGNNKRKTIKEFIIDAKSIHDDKYDYSLVEYKNSGTKVKIICPVHGIFEQRPRDHLSKKCGCPECGTIRTAYHKRLTMEKFIKKAKMIHGDKYDYSLVVYKNYGTKVKIICPVHGIFKQTPDHHLKGSGCSKCVGKYNKSYKKLNIPPYDTFQPQLEPYGVKCRRNKEDKNILEVKCMYCDRWYIPSYTAVQRKIKTINGKISGESNLYCSDECKKACPTYGQILYPKDFKINTSREVQPELRKLVLKRDNYTCQKCNTTDVELHCHHYEGVEVNPVESADIDQCITLCKKCHNNIHKKDKCGMKDYKRGKCNEMERMAA